MIYKLSYNILFFAVIMLLSCTEAYKNDYQEKLEEENPDLIATENDTASRAEQTQFYLDNQTEKSFALQVANYLKHDLACYTVGYPDTYHKVFFLVLENTKEKLPFKYILVKAQDPENTVYTYYYIEGPQNFPGDGGEKFSHFKCHDLKLNDLDRDGIKELIHISKAQLGEQGQYKYILSIFDDEPEGYSYSQDLTSRYFSFYEQNEVLDLFKDTEQPLTLTSTNNIRRNLMALEGRVYHMIKMKGERLICCNCQDYSLAVKKDGTGDYHFVMSEGEIEREFNVDSIKLQPNSDEVIYYGKSSEDNDKTIKIDRAVKDDLDMINYGDKLNYMLSDDVDKIEINPKDCPEE